VRCREKKRRKNYFDLAEAIHEAEYKNLKHPTDPKSKQPIEPAHKFEVTIEEDKYTEEKYGQSLTRRVANSSHTSLDTVYSRITSRKCTKSLSPRYQRPALEDSCVPAWGRVLYNVMAKREGSVRTINATGWTAG
jgi:hypothetical protein